MIDQNNFERYASIKRTIKSLEEDASKIKTLIEKEMEELGEKEIEKECGTFVLAERTNYEYSNDIKKLEAELKRDKRKEEKQGLAKPSINKYLRYVPAKEN